MDFRSESAAHHVQSVVVARNGLLFQKRLWDDKKKSGIRECYCHQILAAAGLCCARCPARNHTGARRWSRIGRARCSGMLVFVRAWSARDVRMRPAGEPLESAVGLEVRWGVGSL